jgi:hypothetical protein
VWDLVRSAWENGVILREIGVHRASGIRVYVDVNMIFVQGGSRNLLGSTGDGCREEEGLAFRRRREMGDDGINVIAEALVKKGVHFVQDELAEMLLSQ